MGHLPVSPSVFRILRIFRCDISLYTLSQPKIRNIGFVLGTQSIVISKLRANRLPFRYATR